MYKSQKCCSLSCGLIKKDGALPYTKEEVERKILELAKKENRTPIQTTTEKDYLPLPLEFLVLGAKQ